MKERKARGIWAKLPCLPLPPDRNRGGEDRGAGGVNLGAPSHGGCWGEGGKEGGGYWDSIPGPTSGWDGSMRWGDEDRRRWAEVAAAAALQGQEGGARELSGFVEERMRAEGVFIAKEWRWQGGGGEELRLWRSGGFGGAP